MLLHYQMDDPHLTEKQPIEITLKDTVSLRRAKN